MFKVITRAAIIGFVAMFGAVVGASAQIPAGSAVRFNVSEAFVVNNKVFPAGNYTITRADAVNTPSMLEISGNRESMLFDTIESDVPMAAGESGVVFEKVGDAMYLTKILMTGDEDGYQLVLPRSEKAAIAATTE